MFVERVLPLKIERFSFGNDQGVVSAKLFSIVDKRIALDEDSTRGGRFGVLFLQRSVYSLELKALGECCERFFRSRPHRFRVIDDGRDRRGFVSSWLVASSEAVSCEADIARAC